MGPPQKGRLIYSTGPSGSAAVPPRAAAPAAPAARLPREHQVRVRREKAGRAGKTVTTAGPLHLARSDASELLAALKRALGSGGALAAIAGPDGAPAFALELQGDHAERLVAELEKRGFPAKRTGG
jgi:translation initiation factor 1 (eIF-1/SUI1)